jgi:hypothetical protein
METKTWIPVGDRLPPAGPVLVATGEGKVLLAYRTEKPPGWISNALDFGFMAMGHPLKEEVTHWMPLPGPPPKPPEPRLFYPFCDDTGRIVGIACMADHERLRTDHLISTRSVMGALIPWLNERVRDWNWG